MAKRPTEKQLLVLRNLFAGRDMWDGYSLKTQGHHGGATTVLCSLHHRGYLDRDNNLTAAGHEAVRDAEGG